MELHHGKHHATYVANVNKALEQYAEAQHAHDLQKMIALQSAINFNGGGELPHTTNTACNLRIAWWLTGSTGAYLFQTSLPSFH